MPAPPERRRRRAGRTRSWSAEDVRSRTGRRSRSPRRPRAATDRTGAGGGSRQRPRNPDRAPDRRLRKLLVAELAAQADQRHHGPGPCLSALPLGQPPPQPVVALRPAALGPPLRQRCRSAQRAGLPVQHFEVMFQIEDLLQTAIAALVAGDPRKTTFPGWSGRNRRKADRTIFDLGDLSVPPGLGWNCPTRNSSSRWLLHSTRERQGSELRLHIPLIDLGNSGITPRQQQARCCPLSPK
jgi:hypothetical protein